MRESRLFEKQPKASPVFSSLIWPLLERERERVRENFETERDRRERERAWRRRRCTTTAGRASAKMRTGRRSPGGSASRRCAAPVTASFPEIPSRFPIYLRSWLAVIVANLMKKIWLRARIHCPSAFLAWIDGFISIMQLQFLYCSFNRKEMRKIKCDTNAFDVVLQFG